MSDSHRPVLEVPLEDEDGEHLLAKADALMRRHGHFAAPAEPDDLPVLTDVVDYPGEEAPPDDSPPDITPVVLPNARDDQTARIVDLEAAITRSIDAWVSTELPQIMSREFDAFAERLREAAREHMRTTLLPTLTAQIEKTLDTEE